MDVISSAYIYVIQVGFYLGTLLATLYYSKSDCALPSAITDLHTQKIPKEMATLEYKQKLNKLIAGLFTRFPILVNLWVRRSKFVEFSDSPWTRVTMPASQCRLALVTTSGVHLLSQPPL